MANTTTKKPKNPIFPDFLRQQAKAGAPPSRVIDPGQGLVDRLEGNIPRPFMGPPAPSMLQTVMGQNMRTGPGMGPPVPPPPQNLSPSLQAMQAAGPVRPDMIAGMMGARERGLLRERTQQPGPMPGAPAAGPAVAGGGAVPKPAMPFNPSQAAPGGMTPDQKAIIDDMFGKRVHKDLSGRQIGLQGVSPALKYMLYAKRSRRHIGAGGKDIY